MPCAFRPTSGSRRTALGSASWSRRPTAGKDDYRQSLWVVPADGSSPPRRLTLGARNDTTPRWSPDGRTIAFLSDRSAVLDAGGAGEHVPSSDDERRLAEERRPGKLPDDATQVWLLPLDGGEATQLTRLPERRHRHRVASRRIAAVRRLCGDDRAQGPTRPEARSAARPRRTAHRPAAVPAQRRRLHL